MACGWVPLARPAKEKGFAGIGQVYSASLDEDRITYNCPTTGLTAYPRLENPQRNPSYSIDFPWQDGCLTYESCEKQTSEREYNQNCLCLGQFLSHLPGSFALKIQEKKVMNQIRLLHLCQSATTSKRGKPGGGYKRSKKAFTILFPTQEIGKILLTRE